MTETGSGSGGLRLDSVSDTAGGSSNSHSGPNIPVPSTRDSIWRTMSRVQEWLENKQTAMNSDLHPRHVSTEPDSEDDETKVSHEIQADEVFGNSLILERICSFLKISNAKDLLNLRVANYLFQEEASKRLRRLHHPKVLRRETQIQELLKLMKKREELELTPFPFSAFEINFDMKPEILERFGAEVGPHVEAYKFRPYFSSRNPMELGGQLVHFLSHSPQLTALTLENREEFCVSDEDFLRVPASFSALNLLVISGDQSPCHTGLPLIDILLSRTPHLTKLRLSANKQSLIMRILRFLAQQRPGNLPLISFENCFKIEPERITLVQEIIGLKLPFSEISICVQEGSERDPAADVNVVRTLVQTVGWWLERQRNILKHLSIDLCLRSTSPSFAFPVLGSLTSLSIRIPAKEQNMDVVVPFLGNPFPSLRTLQLECYREELGLFDACSLTSVKELRLCDYKSPLTNPNWGILFPNLTSLHVDLDFSLERFYFRAFRFILTHMTELEDLDLGVNTVDQQYPFCGMGGRYSNLDFRTLFMGEPGADKEVPVNGVYRVASLRNMKRLKTLRFFPRFRMNVDAVVYMSRRRQVVPLQNLTLSKFQYDTGLKDVQIAEYRAELAKYHQEVLME